MGAPEQQVVLRPILSSPDLLDGSWCKDLVTFSEPCFRVNDSCERFIRPQRRPNET